MKNSEAVILAGGLGTRLSGVIHDLPKPMAPVGEYPFLFYILHFLEQQGIRHTVLSVGHMHQTIINAFGNSFKSMKLSYAIENEPLGTGGGIKLASGLISSPRFFLLNGDTFFHVNLQQLSEFHLQNKALISVALKPLTHFDRYGVVEMAQNGQIIAFKEKKACDKGLINGGIYIVERRLLENYPLQKFSFEQNILEKETQNATVYGQPFDGYFIDIGIPEDYYRIQREISTLKQLLSLT
ncbi:MAG TPA: nucleotidyltransferase family protein [Salinivirgaceae bacterium]|nr:nucleotidyltransferase family protein [Salinivirgaceae bacterium]